MNLIIEYLIYVFNVLQENIFKNYFYISVYIIQTTSKTTIL